LIQAHHKADRQLKQIGDFYFDDTGNLVIWLPNGANLCTINLTKSEKPRWKMSGTRDCPTLEPSLHLVGVWHGFLKDGKLISC